MKIKTQYLLAQFYSLKNSKLVDFCNGRELIKFLGVTYPFFIKYFPYSLEQHRNVHRVDQRCNKSCLFYAVAQTDGFL